MSAKHKAARAANLDFALAQMRFDAIAHRMRREGDSRELGVAFVEAVAEMADALKALDAARYAPQFDPEVYRLIDGGAS